MSGVAAQYESRVTPSLTANRGQIREDVEAQGVIFPDDEDTGLKEPRDLAIGGTVIPAR